MVVVGFRRRGETEKQRTSKGKPVMQQSHRIAESAKLEDFNMRSRRWHLVRLGCEIYVINKTKLRPFDGTMKAGTKLLKISSQDTASRLSLAASWQRSIAPDSFIEANVQINHPSNFIQLPITTSFDPLPSFPPPSIRPKT